MMQTRETPMNARNWYSNALRQCALALAAACLCAAALATEPPASATSTTLPGVLVQGKKDAFVESDRRLAALKAGLPLLGTDQAAKTTFVDRAAAYYDAHRDPNDLHVEQQILLLQLMGADVRIPDVAAP